MKKTGWKRKIKAACKGAGTYREQFDPVIDTLAAILEKRDAAEAKYRDTGEHVLVSHTNKANQKNIVLNPLLRHIGDLNRDALAYWRDLGLTPAGLRKINEDALKPRRASPLAEAIRDLGPP